jgi:RNA polymerase sigma-B factor
MRHEPVRGDVRRDPAHERAREQLILRHTPLARSIARRYARKGLPLDDITQSGYIGLIQAVDRFDPERGVPLERYAARMIEGEIMHLFRDRGWAVRMPRGLQEASRRVAGARDELAHRLGASPSCEQVAEYLGEDVDAVAEALAAARAYRAEHLSEGADEPAENDWRPAHASVEEDGYALAEDRAQVTAALSVLAPRERTIVMLRYYEDLTQSEIAERMQISQMHVSRLLRASLEAMGREVRGSAA